jgi:zinc protease
MMFKKNFHLLFMVVPLLLFIAHIDGQTETLDLNQKLPVDPKITIGEFENGLRYYIRVNKKPENRANLWLAVNAGSVLESDAQQGLAHLAEHMAFNGTKNFEKQELIDYLESIGMQFGPEVNAYTSFDETVYMLQVPTDSNHIVETGFQILEDWAHQVSFDDQEIDKERGVVIEEWRLGRGANQRMLDKQLPVLFKGSRYADRLPIGKKEIVESCSYETLRQYYRDWYRPDLQAIIAIGDFDPAYIEGLIEKHFKHLPKRENALERKMFTVPDHEETLYAIASDPEATQTTIGVYFKKELEKEQTLGDFRRMFMENLYNTMLNYRLDELRQQADPPFLYGYSAKGRFVRTKEVYFLGAAVKEGGIERGLDALLTESMRVKQYGFTESELERAKTAILRGYERAYTERDKTESETYADEYVRNFLTDEPIPGIENEYKYAQAMVPGITLQEINLLVNDYITDGNRVIRLGMPEKEGVHVPTDVELAAVFMKAQAKEIQPYEDAVSDEPLVAKIPQPGKIVKETYLKDIDVTEWTLSNGIQVRLKSTDFKNDEIVFEGFSWGGSSVGPDEDWWSLRTASSIVQQSGIGTFDRISLRKKLTGKVVGVSPYIDWYSEGFSGGASPKDLETMFQLIYLYFTSPRYDETAFAAYKAQMKGSIENRNARPETIFSDTVSVFMGSNHPRRQPWTLDRLDLVEHEKAVDFYKNRFADAGDFRFVFVGNFQADSIKPLILTYLGSLPDLKRKEMYKDPNVVAPKGVHRKVVEKGIEEKARVQLVFTGPYKWSRENNYAFYALRDVLDIKLREVVREDKSGTYGVGVWSFCGHVPKEEYNVNIAWGCDPQRIDELVDAVFETLDSLKNFGPDDIYITKVRETQLRQFEVNLKENSFWRNQLKNAYYDDFDPLLIINRPEEVANLSKEMIQKAAKKYLNKKNYVKFILLPEKKEKSPDI